MNARFLGKLTELADSRFSSKGALSVALIVTRASSARGLPLEPESMLTGREGQVAGLSKGAVQKILSQYGIEQILAQEGGRTSRGSIENMRVYLGLLNEAFNSGEIGSQDLGDIESFWISRAREYFAAKPLRMTLDTSRSVRSMVRLLLDAAERRQRAAGGAQIVGIVLQHVVGAKLSVVLPAAELTHHGACVADTPTVRPGDFEVGDACIHVSTAPSQGLIEKCQQNIDSRLHPIIVTKGRGVAVAEGLLENASIADRVDVLDIEQFLAANILERSGFAAGSRKVTADALIAEYNRIIDECETDPGLRIEVT